MILLGKEVAVLLAPELERRLLMSRSGRDVATQTDITQVRSTINNFLRPLKLLIKIQIFVKRSMNKGPQPIAPQKEKPIWGANRTNKKYIKQSDKDIYRQRGCSLNSRSKMTTDSDSDRYPR
jgi:hypothetical protein